MIKLPTAFMSNLRTSLMYIGVQDRMVYEPQLLHMWAAIMAQTAGEEVILRHGIGSFCVEHNCNSIL